MTQQQKNVSLVDAGMVGIYVSALTYSTAFYILSHYEDKPIVKERIRMMNMMARTSDFTDKVVDQGLVLQFLDIEYVLWCCSALAEGCKVIITRNEKKLKASTIPVLLPDEYLNSLKDK